MPIGILGVWRSAPTTSCWRRATAWLLPANDGARSAGRADVAGMETASWIVSLGRGLTEGYSASVRQPRIFSLWRAMVSARWAAKVHPKRGAQNYSRTGLASPRIAFRRRERDYDLTNIGTLSAFAIVCIGVIVWVHGNQTGRGHLASIVGPWRWWAGAHIHHDGFTAAWERFGIWTSWLSSILVRHRTLLCGADRSRKVDPPPQCTLTVPKPANSQGTIFQRLRRSRSIVDHTRDGGRRI